MQTANTRNVVTRAFREELDRVFTSIGQGFNACLETLSRARELERLSSMSDEQLSRLGLSREDIVHHVFRDRFHA